MNHSQIRHPHNHGAARIEWQVLKTPTAAKGANCIVQRMRNDAGAADQRRRLKRRPQSKEEQRPRMPPPLVTAVNRELTEQRRGDWIRPVALLRLRQPGPLDLGRAQGHIANDPPVRLIRQNRNARSAAHMIDPGMALLAPGGLGLAQFLKLADRFRGRGDPRLELLPVFGGDRYHRPAEHLDLGGLQSLPAHEVAQCRARLLGGGFKDGALVRANADA